MAIAQAGERGLRVEYILFAGWKRHALTCLAGVLMFLLPCAGIAHDIPTDVKIHLFVKPEAQRLRLLVRVPLNAMREVDFPKRGPGYLDLSRAHSALDTAAKLWLVDNMDVYEGAARLQEPRLVQARVSLPSDLSFRSYEEALAHVTGPPLDAAMQLYWEQALLDVLLEYPIASERSEFAIDPRFARLGLKVVTVLRFLPPDGVERAFELQGNAGVVHLDPRWHQAALRFVQLGFEHILGGTDHLLFVLCLVIPFRRLRPLIFIVTAFTVAHSVTLMAAAFGWVPSALWFPPLIEWLIAISILYMALENIVGSNVRRRWVIAFAFGLVHGFGFSFALRETLQFAGSHLVTSLLAFNVGIELGQLLVLLLLVPALEWLFRSVMAERMGIIILSAFVAHTAWHWMLERGERLSQFPWPALSAAQLAVVTRGLMALVTVAGIVWLATTLVRERRQSDETAAGESVRTEA